MDTSIKTQANTVASFVIKNFNLTDMIAYTQEFPTVGIITPFDLIIAFEKVMDLEGIYLARIEAVGAQARQESWEQCPE